MTAFIERVDRAPTQRFWKLKYAVERVIATVAFLASLPLFILLAIAIKASSAGPILYVSERLGRNGRTFRLLKFRSMKVGVEAILGPDGKVLTIVDDPRATPIGRFLRLGFDELPQLINVIRGEMCLVGPRPDVTTELERYTPRQRERLEVLPGITGLAAVVGGRFMCNADNYELDVVYVRESSFFTDCKILLLTVPYSLGWEKIGAWVFQDILQRVKENTRALGNAIST